jgi:hypothetical protein
MLDVENVAETNTGLAQVNLTTGYAPTTGCSGMIQPIARFGFPGMCLTDAGNGVRNTDYVSAWPAGIHVGARCVHFDRVKRILKYSGELTGGFTIVGTRNSHSNMLKLSARRQD